MVFSYIKHLVKAKRHYGLHSPFIYDFSSRCLTQKIPQGISSTWEFKRPSRTKKVKEFLYKLAGHYALQSYLILHKNSKAYEETAKKLSRSHQTLLINTVQEVPNQKFDCILLDEVDCSSSELLKAIAPCIHDETFVVIRGINTKKSNKPLWKHVLSDTNFHVTIDVFDYGIALHRKHQNKEHFIIRR